MFHLEKANAEEFLEVYKGVVSEYSVSVFSESDSFSAVWNTTY